MSNSVKKKKKTSNIKKMKKLKDSTLNRDSRLALSCRASSETNSTDNGFDNSENQ